ncbi:MAG: CinA family protein [Campylobacterota bacterium]|nr:CinA family protein [Campylobacterota bacterium]
MKNLHMTVEKIILELIKRGKSISFAESCTGGRIASEFTAISGASNVLNGSCITYSNEIKHKWLNVSKDTLKQYGAVSQECVSQMLDGIVSITNADYAIAVSGIAGPSGGTVDKPVGTVYIGLLTPKEKQIYHCQFEGARNDIQNKATTFAIEKLEEKIKK